MIIEQPTHRAFRGRTIQLFPKPFVPEGTERVSIECIRTKKNVFLREINGKEPDVSEALQIIRMLVDHAIYIGCDPDVFTDVNSVEFKQSVEKAKGRIPSVDDTLQRNGWVYLMKDNYSGATKIGYSKNPEFREKTLLAQTPSVTLVEQYIGSMANEKDLHKMFAKKRVRGEWFMLDDLDLVMIADFFSIL